MRARTRRAVTASLAALAVAAVLLFLVVRYVSRHPDQANLGSEVIRVDAERMTERIAETGPLPFQDPQGDRDVYLQHTGDHPGWGWILVLAYPPGHEGEKRCALTWEAGAGAFRSSCTDTAYPPDGAGLTTYPAPVEHGKVIIDLR